MSQFHDAHHRPSRFSAVHGPRHVRRRIDVALGCASSAPSGAGGSASTDPAKPLKACFSNAGLQSTWCAHGKKTAELWGKLLNVEIEWVDGEFDPEKQRNKIDAITSRDFDFCCFQAVQIDSLAEPVKRLKERNIPVISMDTLLVSMDQMRDTGVWCEVTPDHVNMAEMAKPFLISKKAAQKPPSILSPLNAYLPGGEQLDLTPSVEST